MNSDRDLFWKLVEPEHLRARAFCRKLTGDRDNGDDLYQDALVSALTGFGRLNDHGAFRPWLYRIMINTYKNRVRHNRRNKTMPLTDDHADRVGGAHPDQARSARRRLEIAFDALSPEERALVTLHDLQGWPPDELATMWGKSEGAIRVRLSRARTKMRAVLIKHLQRAGTTATGKPITGKDTICIAQKPASD